MKKYEEVKSKISQSPKIWLVTGVAGFIGSNLLEKLLMLNQKVVGVDNFSTGYLKNLESVRGAVGEGKWMNLKFIEGDIRNRDICQRAMYWDYEKKIQVDYVLHQAALGSVPRSIKNPLETNSVNIEGFLNVMDAAREAKVTRMVYAASSSTYGDHEALPKIESVIGKPLSPYAVTKYVNELYAEVYSKVYKFSGIGLRYFNVFGRRQDFNSGYSAVIPKWINSVLINDDIYINGDGYTSRDFCYIDNVIQANILAAVSTECNNSEIYNVAVGGRTTLNELHSFIVQELSARGVNYQKKPCYRDFREGDVRHSMASIEKIRGDLGYQPKYDVRRGLKIAMDYYLSEVKKQ